MQSFIKIGSGIQKLTEEIYIHTHRISLLLFFLNNDIRLKMNVKETVGNVD
jgi:hypothetical protein